MSRPSPGAVGVLDRRASIGMDLSKSEGSNKNKFWLEPEEVLAMRTQHGLSEDELLQMLITPAATLARPPISSFHVGAVGLGISGRIYFGVNLEFVRLPLYNSVHAEQFLVVNAIHHQEREIIKLAVSAAPCGHCRQFYSELSCANTIQFMFGKDGHTYTLAQLLPQRFGPADLLDDPSTPLLLQPQNNDLVWSREAEEALQARQGDGHFQDAAASALEQATQSYAPYSRCPAGLAIVTAKGGVYSGSYYESAAFNPSLPPLQSAMVDAVIDGMPCYTAVLEVVLVELRGVLVEHALTTKVFLGQIAPDAKLTILHAQWKERVNE
ncbi:hypothetical protein WJX72_007282 [[Myrmecia] bisecta]|uniref:cytidine deaminase n=1 Tax=[Myrmecia] bisecta TaxID=41462 RepID=A0AAW1P9Z6_9CHLO